MGPRANNHTRAIVNYTRVNNRTVRQTQHEPDEGDTRSRQRTVTQIDAKARRLLAGLVARGLLVRRGEEGW